MIGLLGGHVIQREVEYLEKNSKVKMITVAAGGRSLISEFAKNLG